VLCSASRAVHGLAAAIVLLVLCGSLAVRAQDQPQAPSTAACASAAVGLTVNDKAPPEGKEASAWNGDRLRLHFPGLLEQVKGKVSAVRLFLNGMPVTKEEPTSFNPTGESIVFRLRFALEDKPVLASVLGQEKVRVGIGTLADGEFKCPEAWPTLTFSVLEQWRFYAGIVLVVLLLVGIFVLAAHPRTTAAFRDSEPEEDVSERPFSLARSQMAFWFFLVASSLLFIWLVTGDFNGVVSGSTLALFGISLATGVTAAAVDTLSPTSTEKEWPKHSTFFGDILSDGEGSSFHRFQMLAWTLILGLIFVVGVCQTFRLPEFDTNLLALMGISGGLYAGFKWRELKPADDKETPTEPAKPKPEGS
jgi:hypothetical protein